MKISTKSQYGLRAMVFLAKSKKGILALREISEKEGIPFSFLEKIISKLEKEKLVKAKKGVKGGYFLSKPSNKIKVGQIIKTLEGDMFLVKCIDKKYFCPQCKKCLTKSFWEKIQNSLEKSLNSLTLADLVK